MTMFCVQLESINSYIIVIKDNIMNGKSTVELNMSLVWVQMLTGMINC